MRAGAGIESTGRSCRNPLARSLSRAGRVIAGHVQELGLHGYKAINSITVLHDLRASALLL